MISIFSQIQKRNGTMVHFDAQKITNAISKAAGVAGVLDAGLPIQMTEKIVKLLDEHFIQPEKPLSVEQIQDIEEIVLMKSGELKVAKEYILYREEHKKMREKKQKEIRAKVEGKSFPVKNESGEEEIFDTTKWAEKIHEIGADLKKIEPQKILDEAVKLLYDGMP